MTTIAPIHPGEVLLEDFLTPLGLTQHHLAISISVPPRRINEIVHGKRRMRLVARAVAFRAADENVAQKLHFHFFETHAAAALATAGAGVE